jgi:hypothetical protein
VNLTTHLLLATVSLFAPIAYAEEPRNRPQSATLFLQDYQQSHECFDWRSQRHEPCGLLIEALLNIDEKRFRSRMTEQYRRLTAELPLLDLPALTREAFCTKLELADEACVGPKFIGSEAVVRPVSFQPGSIVLRIGINLYQEGSRRGLRVIVTPHVVGADGVPQAPRFYAWYDSRAPRQLRGDPLEDPDAHAYWFAGSPSRMETELRRAMLDTASLIRLLLEHQADKLPGAEFSTWWESLPTLRSLRDAGTLQCRGMECRSRYVSVQGDRIWYAPETVGAVVLSSTSLGDFQKQ